MDENEVTPLKIKNNDLLTKSQLQNFNISLPAKSFKSYLIDEINHSNKHTWVNL